MYRNGSFVTLAIDKSHHDGQDNMHLAAGTAGMIVQVRRVPTGQEQVYVVDFGAYGQWNCLHSELHGDDDPNLTVDSEGEQRVRRSPIADVFRDIQISPTGVARETREPEDRGEEPAHEEEEKINSESFNIEDEIARRVAELEREIK